MGQGLQVTDAQVKELRQNLNRRASLRQAAMKAGMDRKTGRKYRDGGQLPSECRAAHTWRTRVDPLVEVWPRLEELLQGEPRLQAKTLVEVLEREYPGQDWQQRRRTVERRVRQWRAEHGPAKEVFFSQVHEPGRLGSSDFTHMEHLNITLQGQPFPHLVYHFVLTHSNWEHATLCFSESFASLSEGLQNALWELGAAPERHRTDRMTLAVHHDGNPEEYTAKYQALMNHYGVTPEATNAYSGHENGDCEQGHRRFKEALEQELLLRGSRDFASREDYWKLVRALLARRNAGRVDKFAEEQARLRPLPARRLETLERKRVRVGQGSTIQVQKNTYSVPARLRGEWVEARVGAEVIEVWYAGALVQRMERLRGQSKHRIDYRHVIAWLVRKPGAFARYVYREDMYPSVTFRRAYDALLAQQPGRADREYLRLLELAAHEGESHVEEALSKLLEQAWPLSAQGVQTLLGSATPLSVAAQVSVPAVDLRWYDALLEGASAAGGDIGMSQDERNKEESDARGRDGGAMRCLQQLRLATVRSQHEEVARQATAESWSYATFLVELLSRECQQRQHNRIERLLKASRLPLEKNWASLDLKRLPPKAVQQLRGLLSGEFLDRRENVLVFGPPGSGKTHGLCAVAQELVRAGRPVLHTKCSLLVQELLKAKRDLRLKEMLRELSHWEGLLIDDLGYVQQSREEMEVLFTLLAERYERGSVLVTSNLAFSQWEQIFKDPMTTAAVIDRLVHHSVIMEMNVPSYRAESAKRSKGQSKPPEAG